jgi:hypothetical protein
MRWIALIVLVALAACSSPEPGPSQKYWGRSDGTALLPAEAEQTLATCIVRMSDVSYTTGTPAFNSPSSYQRFNEQFKSSRAFAVPSSAEMNTCMHAEDYQLAR